MNSISKFRIPEDLRAALAEIFTDAMIPAIEDACARYLYEVNKERFPTAEDGRRLLEIAQKARELRQLLKKSKSAFERVRHHMSEEYEVYGVALFVADLENKLKRLDDMAFVNPAAEMVKNPRKGRPKGTTAKAERMLAFHLWEIYRQAHGDVAKRTWNHTRGREEGPLALAITILRPLLKLREGFVRGDLTRLFREIEKEHMAIKSGTGE